MPSWGCGGLLLLLAVTASAEVRWLHVRSLNFELFSTAPEKTARETLRQLEQARAFFAQRGDAARLTAPVRVVLFGSTDEFEPFRMNSFATSYYRYDLGGHTIVLNQPANRHQRAGGHEYVHLWIRQTGRTLPPWLEEGLSEYYSTLWFPAGQAVAGAVPEGRSAALLRARYARRLAQDGARAETEAALGLLAWRDDDLESAKGHFRRAYQAGAETPTLQEYLDYVELRDPERAAAVRAELHRVRH